MQGQAEGAPGVDRLYIGSNSGGDNKIGVAGSRFLRGVAGKVYYDEEYEEYKKIEEYEEE